LFIFHFIILSFYRTSYTILLCLLCLLYLFIKVKQERQEYTIVFFNNRCACGTRMSIKDGPFCKIHSTRARRIHVHCFLDRFGVFRIERFLAIINKDRYIWIIHKDNVRCFSCIKHNIGIIDDLYVG